MQGNMNHVHVLKAEVVEALTRNREEHRAIFEEANATYRQKVIDAMRARADAIEGGADIDTSFTLPKPEDHTEDYDEALETLRYEQRDELDLTRHCEFQEWVLNKWNWDHSFSKNTTSYTAAGARR